MNNLKHQASIEFSAKDMIYQISNADCPGFLKAYGFQDEFEASLAYSLWLQFSKGKENPNYNEFQWVLRATFRIVGTPSVWAD